MDLKPDVEARIFLNNRRKNGVINGYRPPHLILDNYLTTGMHEDYSVKELFPGKNAVGTITFLTPEYCPHSLWIGRKVYFYEGIHSTGYIEITKICNPILEKTKISKENRNVRINSYHSQFIREDMKTEVFNEEIFLTEKRITLSKYYEDKLIEQYFIPINEIGKIFYKNNIVGSTFQKARKNSKETLFQNLYRFMEILTPRRKYNFGYNLPRVDFERIKQEILSFIEKR